MQKFHIQWELTEMATPRVLASRGRISGPQTHGTTLTVPPRALVSPRRKFYQNGAALPKMSM